MKRWLHKNSLYFWFIFILIMIGAILGIIASVVSIDNRKPYADGNVFSEQYTLGVEVSMQETEEPTAQYTPEELLAGGLEQ